MSRATTIAAGVYLSFFLHSEVFEDVKKNQMQVNSVMFAGQWLCESLFQIMFLCEVLPCLP